MTGFQVMPRLSADEYAALEQDILARGVVYPIVVAADGRIVDGHHRDEIARKYSLHCPRVVIEGADEELRDQAFSLNAARRNFTREQKRDLVKRSLTEDPQKSDRHHARRTGVSNHTVAAVRADLVESGQIAHFSERIDPRTGNASQPATKPEPTTFVSGPGVDGVLDVSDWSEDEIAEVLDEDNAGVTYSNTPIPEGLPPFDPRTGEALDGESEGAAVTTTPEPKPHRRSPLPDAFTSASLNLTRAVTRLANLAEDDRLPQNKEKVAAANRSDLLRAIDALQRVVASLD